MKLGEEITVVKVCKEQTCFECGEPAKYKHTYLIKGSRSNPFSSAYGKDDCSWCEDETSFACEEHKDKVKNESCPEDMRWCSTFTRDKGFEHLFLYWKELEAPAPVDVRGEISSIVVDIYRTGYSRKNGEQQASDYVKNKIDQLLILYPHLSQPRVSVEDITKIVEQEMLPFAEGEWRKDFPKDSWEWGEKELKMLAKQIGRVVADFLNKGGNNG